MAAYPLSRQLSSHYVIQGTGLGGLIDNVYTRCVHLVPTENGLRQKWICSVHPHYHVPAPIKRCLSAGGKLAVAEGTTAAIMGTMFGPFAEVTVPVGAAGAAISGAIQGCVYSLL